MIMYVFNHLFPEASGFGKRCQREIEALAELDAVTVICRASNTKPLTESYPSPAHPITIQRFAAQSSIVHRPSQYVSNGFYEISRNLELLWHLTQTLFKVMRQTPASETKLFVVTSPLTVPLIGLIIAKLVGVEPYLVSFHDLEPELAMHIKHLSPRNWIVRIEFWLEALVCRQYKKVLVTSAGQAESLQTRCGLPKTKLGIIPNVSEMSLPKKSLTRRQLGFKPQDLIIAYVSMFSFDYTLDGIKDILTAFAATKSQFPQIKFLLIGGGEGLPVLKRFIKSHKLTEQVVCSGTVENPAQLLSMANAGLIPWKADIMTETMLPTKLFEYLSFGLPVIAPQFGEFKRLLRDRSDALLYTDADHFTTLLGDITHHTKMLSEVGHAGQLLFNQNYRPALLKQELQAFVQS